MSKTSSWSLPVTITRPGFEPKPLDLQCSLLTEEGHELPSSHDVNRRDGLSEVTKAPRMIKEQRARQLTESREFAESAKVPGQSPAGHVRDGGQEKGGSRMTTMVTMVMTTSGSAAGRVAR